MSHEGAIYADGPIWQACLAMEAALSAEMPDITVTLGLLAPMQLVASGSTDPLCEVVIMVTQIPEPEDFAHGGVVGAAITWRGIVSSIDPRANLQLGLQLARGMRAVLRDDRSWGGVVDTTRARPARLEFINLDQTMLRVTRDLEIEFEETGG